MNQNFTDNSKSVILGGCSLAFLASALNVSFMLQLGTSVSHLTGDLSRFSVDVVLYSINYPLIRLLVAALIGFTSGSCLSGYLIHHPTLDTARPYGRSVSFIGLLFIAAYLAIKDHQALAVFLASSACGFQNALASHYRGLILRTTHITGLLTDFGVYLGMKLKGHRIDNWKILIMLLLVTSFFLGSLAGAMATVRFEERTVLYIGVTYIIGGLIWSIAKHFLTLKHEQSTSSTSP